MTALSQVKHGLSIFVHLERIQHFEMAFITAIIPATPAPIAVRIKFAETGSIYNLLEIFLNFFEHLFDFNKFQHLIL